MLLYYAEQLVSTLLLLPSGNPCPALLQMVTAKSRAQVFWTLPKGKLQKHCGPGTRLALSPPHSLAGTAQRGVPLLTPDRQHLTDLTVKPAGMLLPPLLFLTRYLWL